MPMASPASARAPSAPVTAPLSPEAIKQVQEPKKSLSVVSWELTGAGAEQMPMQFSEAGSEAHAKMFLSLLK